MSHKLEIILSNKGNKEVNLNAMTEEELNSFMVVVNSLKNMVLSLTENKESISFSMFEGSAGFAVQFREEAKLQEVREEIEIAIEGNSSKESVTSNLRAMQKQLRREEFYYKFSSNEGGNSLITLHERLITAKDIRRKRQGKTQGSYQLQYVKGKLQAVGGKKPNYHLDFVSGEEIVVQCREEEAKRINRFLYEYVAVVALVQLSTDESTKSIYRHQVILSRELENSFAYFLGAYNQIEDDLVQQLGLMYDFVREEFKKDKNQAFEILKMLLTIFNDKNLHSSELKTLLIISKSFEQHLQIKEARFALLNTWEAKKRK